MKNKFKYLIKYSLKKKIDTKWFKVVNILLLLLIVFLVNMDYLINLFGGDFNEKEKIYVVDNTNTFDSFKNYFTALAASIDDGEYEIVLSQNILNDKEEIDDEIVVVLNSSSTNYLAGEIVSYDTVSRTTYEMIVNTLNALKSEMVLKESGLTKEEITSLSSPVEITETVLNESAKDNATKENLSAVITTVLIIPFFILIVTMVQMLGAEINDEKTSRGMEIIISSVPAKIHFISKVVAALSYVLLQGVLLLIYSGIAILLHNVLATSAGTGTGNMFSEIITLLNEAGVFSLLAKGGIILIILFIVSFIAYAIVAAMLASMTTNIEDFQQLQTPLMIIMMVGYYVALMAVMFDGSIFIHVLSYIPLLSVMIAPTLYFIGEISIISLILTTLITSVATYFLYKYGLRVYKVGILNYSSNKLWKKMFKSLSNKE